jgi:hypothetical protein
LIPFFFCCSQSENAVISAIQSIDLKLDVRVAEVEKQVEDRFLKLDDKITALFDKLFANHIVISSKSIDTRLQSLEERIEIINIKIDNLLTREINDDSAENSQDEPIRWNIMETMNVEFANRIEDILETVEEVNKKIEQNKHLLNRNFNEVLRIKENLHTKNIRQERKERGHDLDQQTELINELLSVVKNKLKVRDDDDAKLLKKSENKTDWSMTLTTIPQKKHQKSNNQTLASKLTSTRKSGIFYPTSTKNILTPPTMNNSATFVSDRDIKVIIFSIV